MAKYKWTISGDFHYITDCIKKEILNTSTSASLEDEEYIINDSCRIGIMVFERYSYTGGNRLSLNVTVIDSNHKIQVIGISSGGSNGVFFKVNTMGEEAFLDKLKGAINKIKRSCNE